MAYLRNESMWICWFLRSLPHLIFWGESTGWKGELTRSAGKGSPVVGVLHLFWGEPGMCCVRASDLEDQSQALHMVWISFFFLYGEGCLTSQGGAQAKLGKRFLWKLGLLIVWHWQPGMASSLLQSHMAPGDAESLASPGTLPGHTGSQNVKKLLGDQGSWQLTIPHTASLRPVPDTPWGGSKVIQCQHPAHTHFRRMEDVLLPPNNRALPWPFSNLPPSSTPGAELQGHQLLNIFFFFCNSLKSN